MSDQIEIDKPLIDQIYPQDEPNQPIDLGQVAVQFEADGKVYQKTANVKMKFLPKDDLQFVVPLEGECDCARLAMLLWNLGGNLELTLPERNITFEALCKGTDEECGGIVFSPSNSAIKVTEPSTAISTATFHLFNFPNIQSSESNNRVILQADGWIITIAATDRTDELQKKLEVEGGYVATHMGRIERRDGATFTSEQFDDLRACLSYFLSFALGCWSGVALPIGFDRDGNRVFEEWGMPRTTDGHWKSYCSWFDRKHGELLPQVFPGFMTLWKRELWRKPLVHALYWYIGAYKGGAGVGVDTGLILSQTALELLAWTYCVQDRKIVSKKKFKPGKLSAAEKLRLLTSDLGIPKEIPSSLSALHKKRGDKWKDGMHAITNIRNSLVHPDNHLQIEDDWYYEVWRLSLWYIALIILRLCGHDGMYANNLGQICSFNKVPWAHNEAS